MKNVVKEDDNDDNDKSKNVFPKLLKYNPPYSHMGYSSKPKKNRIDHKRRFHFEN